MKMYRCKWCRKEFDDRDDAYRHAVVCGMNFVAVERRGDVMGEKFSVIGYVREDQNVNDLLYRGYRDSGYQEFLLHIGSVNCKIRPGLVPSTKKIRITIEEVRDETEV